MCCCCNKSKWESIKYISCVKSAFNLILISFTRHRCIAVVYLFFCQGHHVQILLYLDSLLGPHVKRPNEECCRNSAVTSVSLGICRAWLLIQMVPIDWTSPSERPFPQDLRQVCVYTSCAALIASLDRHGVNHCCLIKCSVSRVHLCVVRGDRKKWEEDDRMEKMLQQRIKAEGWEGTH